MSWLRALRKTTRSGLAVERKRLEPLIALRGSAGLARRLAVRTGPLRGHGDQRPQSAHVTAPSIGPTVSRTPTPTGKGTADATPTVREALLGSRVARAAWYAAVARAQDEPVRHRGLSRTAADDAEDALDQMGRVAMLMEAHLPDRDAPPAAPAACFAETLRAVTEQGAEAVRESRVPRWDSVREALEAWDSAGVPEGGPEAAVRRSAGLLLNSLTELSEALDTAEPPMTVGGSANADGPRTPKDSAART